MQHTRARKLECAACGFVTTHFGGLRRHQVAVHRGRARAVVLRKRRRESSSSSNSSSPETDHDTFGSLSSTESASKSGHGTCSGDEAASESAAESGPADVGACENESLAPHGLAPLKRDHNSSFEAAVDMAVTKFFELTRLAREVQEPNATALRPSEFDYSCNSTKVRAIYESLDDMARSQPIVTLRKHSQTGRFDDPRSRAVLRFVLQVGGGGLSARELVMFLEMFDEWCGSMLDAVVGEGSVPSLQDVFASPNAFLNAVNDEVFSAVLGEGWRRVSLTEGGVSLEAYFTPVLDLLMGLLEENAVQLWRGETGPAPPTDRRQSPMNGDVFLLCERKVVNAHGPSSCILGIHMYSDGSKLSWSGGTYI